VSPHLLINTYKPIFSSLRTDREGKGYYAKLPPGRVLGAPRGIEVRRRSLYEEDFVNALDGLGEEYRNLREIRESVKSSSSCHQARVNHDRKTTECPTPRERDIPVLRESYDDDMIH